MRRHGFGRMMDVNSRIGFGEKINQCMAVVGCAFFALSLPNLASAQIGTRGSGDLGSGGLILNSATGALNLPSQGVVSGVATQGTRSSGSFIPTVNPAPLNVLPAPTTGDFTNARGANIQFETVAPPTIASNPVPIGQTQGTVITQGGTGGSLYVVEGFRDYGDGLPIVSADYEVIDQGRIEETRFGRPTRDLRHVVGGGNVSIVSDDTVNSLQRPVTASASTSQENRIIRSTDTSARTQTVSRSVRRSTEPERDFVGGVKPGVQVALPRAKATPPSRTRRAVTRTVASNSNSTASRKPKSIFAGEKVEAPVRRTPTRTAQTTIRRKPTTSFVSGGALDVGEPTQQAARPAAPAPAPAPAPTPAKVEAPKQVASAEPAQAKEAEPAAKPYLLRILFDKDSAELKEKAKPFLATLANRMKSDKDMQIQLLSYASGSNARRMSLTRALQVRANLIAQGIDSGRMIVKTKGDNPEGGPADRLEIIEIN